jgi:hypothetical protein
MNMTTVKVRYQTSECKRYEIGIPYTVEGEAIVIDIVTAQGAALALRSEAENPQLFVGRK